ncbi:hypothetical protein [uncultured Nostoc sp.]|uniref:hypothetical protein n=1 Tax=uncultured Nostoc sp. TaxID=340711 RepID=UPI00260A94F2|nr:hypothetical protein [uncultured Nostoc sp.]
MDKVELREKSAIASSGRLPQLTFSSWDACGLIFSSQACRNAPLYLRRVAGYLIHVS